tara:strand:+ start:487 stop:786 length:300 start_codon:yes stop_codon:yes gene_type:complete
MRRIILIIMLINGLFLQSRTSINDEIVIWIKSGNHYTYAKTFKNFIEAKQELDILIKKEKFKKDWVWRRYDDTIIFYINPEKTKILRFKFPVNPLNKKN